LAREEMLKHVSYAKYYMLEEKQLTEIRFVAYESPAQDFSRPHDAAATLPS
jgi:hypothetical protein